MSTIAAKKVRRKHKLLSMASSNRVRSREQTIPAAENALSASTLEGGTVSS